MPNSPFQPFFLSLSLLYLLCFLSLILIYNGVLQQIFLRDTMESKIFCLFNCDLHKQKLILNTKGIRKSTEDQINFVIFLLIT